MTDQERGNELIRTAVVQAAQSGPDAARHEVKRRWRWLILFVVSWLAGLTVLTGVYVNYAIDRQNTTDQQVSQLRALADTSKQSGEQANDKLKARGQTPVPIPNPGSAPDADVITAAATAKVLASLPDNTPTSVQLGQAQAEYFAAHPVTPTGPTPAQISAQLAAYFAANPPPAGKDGTNGNDGAPCDPNNPACVGPKGDKGDNGDAGKDGHTPTEAEIQQDFADYLTAHPEALCPRGGVFTLTRVQTADGGSQDAWSCVVATYPSPTDAPPTITDPTAPTTGG